MAVTWRRVEWRKPQAAVPGVPARKVYSTWPDQTFVRGTRRTRLDWGKVDGDGMMGGGAGVSSGVLKWKRSIQPASNLVNLASAQACPSRRVCEL